MSRLVRGERLGWPAKSSGAGLQERLSGVTAFILLVGSGVRCDLTHMSRPRNMPGKAALMVDLPSQTDDCQYLAPAYKGSRGLFSGKRFNSTFVSPAGSMTLGHLLLLQAQARSDVRGTDRGAAN